MSNAEADYQRYRTAIEGEPLPLAAVDLSALDDNIERLLEPIRRSNKQLRVATKSIRCVELIRRIVDAAGDRARGLMSFAVREAAFLVEEGFDDIYVAYPTGAEGDADLLAELNDRGHHVSIAVDSAEHLVLLNDAARRRGTQIPVVLEVDLSYRPMARVHVGVRRSPLHGAEALLTMAQQVSHHQHLRLYGVMGYEAQIAGVPDRTPFAPLLNTPKRIMKRLSRGPVEATRQAIADGLKRRGIEYQIFNGGGSGSLAWCTQESALTEVTAGSGFLDSHLFDYFQDLSVRPAIFFALQVVRHPAPGWVTCHGGGYVASGEAGKDKLPLPYLPTGLKLLDLEGAGEVQTPLEVPWGTIPLGDPVFFRHAKAGELAEHFLEYLWIEGESISRRAPTYRGQGQRFL